MQHLKGIVGCALVFCLTGTSAHADTLKTPAGQLLFPQNSILDVEDTTLKLQHYTQNASGDALATGDVFELRTPVNVITPDAELQFLAQADNTRAYIQFFTDINGDGVYEWVMNANATPEWDVLSKRNTFTPSSSITGIHLMSQSQTRTASADALFKQGLTIEQRRSEEGSTPLEDLDYTSSGDMIVCITFSDQNLHESVSNQDLSSYYLKIDTEGWNDPTLLGAYTFSDMNFTDWYFSGVDYCVREGLFFGSTSTTFNPQGSVTRAMALQAIYNAHGAPEVYPRTFLDIDAEKWYATAFTWALDRSIVGAENRLFRPNDDLTREELIGFLYNYANSLSKIPNQSGKLAEFTDGSEVASQYVQGFLWALEKGLISGDDTQKLHPKTVAARGETAMILSQFMALIS